MMNAYHESLDFHIPSLAAPMSWEALVDTARPTGCVADGTLYALGDVYRLQAHSFALFINRAPRPEVPQRSALPTSAQLTDSAKPGADDAAPS